MQNLTVADLGGFLLFPPFQILKLQFLIKVRVLRPPACCNWSTIILHVYFSNDVASLQKCFVTESEHSVI